MKTVTEELRRKLGTRVLAEQRAARARLLALERETMLLGSGPDGDNMPPADLLEAASHEIAEIELEGSRDALIRRLKKLYRAAEKVREDTYGVCDACGEAIPPARLRAVPEATHCRDCAAELERLEAREARRTTPWVWSEDEMAIAA